MITLREVSIERGDQKFGIIRTHKPSLKGNLTTLLKDKDLHVKVGQKGVSVFFKRFMN